MEAPPPSPLERRQSVPRALAAVDVKDFARHEAGPFQVEDRVDDVGDLAQPADASPRVGLRKSSTVARGDRAGLRSAF